MDTTAIDDGKWLVLEVVDDDDATGGEEVKSFARLFYELIIACKYNCSSRTVHVLQACGDANTTQLHCDINKDPKILFPVFWTRYFRQTSVC